MKKWFFRHARKNGCFHSVWKLLFFRDVAREDLLSKPFHDYVLPENDCLSDGQRVLQLDMKTLQMEDLEICECPFNFEIQRGEVMHGFCTWFEAEFCPLQDGPDTVVLNTGPHKT